MPIIKYTSLLLSLYRYNLCKLQLIPQPGCNICSCRCFCQCECSAVHGRALQCIAVLFMAVQFIALQFMQSNAVQCSAVLSAVQHIAMHCNSAVQYGERPSICATHVIARLGLEGLNPGVLTTKATLANT